MMDYMGMLRSKGVPFSGCRYRKGVPFQGMWKGANFPNLICERVPIFQNLVCERLRGADLGQSFPLWNRSAVNYIVFANLWCRFENMFALKSCLKIFFGNLTLYNVCFRVLCFRTWFKQFSLMILLENWQLHKGSEKYYLKVRCMMGYIVYRVLIICPWNKIWIVTT